MTDNSFQVQPGRRASQDGVPFTNGAASRPFRKASFSSSDPLEQSDQFVKANRDRSNDGEFSLKEAGKNFFKGVVAPIRYLFEHPVQSLTMIGLAAGTLWAFPVLMPLMLGAGLALGGAQLGYGSFKFVNHWRKGEYDAMEKSCQSIGEGASAVGLSAWGIRNHYKTLSLKDGVAQSFKDSTNLVREIIRTRSIPRERTVVLMTTSNKDKIRDLSTYLERENPKGQVRLISLTDDPTKTQLSVRGLPADESTLGSTYETISSGKAAYHSPKELLTGRLQNMDDPFLNGRTLAEAFPGRRIVVVADDSGFGMKLGPEKLSAFGDQLKKRFGMPEDQVETFIRGLDITDDSVQLLGAKTHRNLETLANHLPLKDGKPDKFGAEQLLAEIMQEINLGGGFEFNSAVSARDIFSGHAPKTNLRTTRGQITNEPSAIGVDITDSCPLPEVVKVIDEAGGLNGVKLSQAPREQLSRSQAAEATLANIAQQAARDRVINLANGGAILEHLLEHLTDQ